MQCLQLNLKVTCIQQISRIFHDKNFRIVHVTLFDVVITGALLSIILAREYSKNLKMGLRLCLCLRDITYVNDNVKPKSTSPTWNYNYLGGQQTWVSCTAALLFVLVSLASASPWTTCNSTPRLNFLCSATSFRMSCGNYINAVEHTSKVFLWVLLSLLEGNVAVWYKG